MYKPIAVKGIFDHSQESMIVRTRHEERGYEILAPLYTRVDPQSGELKGIMVNRGRIPLEYEFSKMHLSPPN